VKLALFGRPGDIPFVAAALRQVLIETLQGTLGAAI